MQLSLLLYALLPIFLYCCFIINLYLKKNGNVSTSVRLPPGPRPLPIIGNLHLLTSLPHRAVAELSKAHGPLLLLRLGSTLTVFISSPRLAEQALKANDVAVSARPLSEAAGILSYGGKGMIFGRYGPSWRKLRRLFNSNLLSAAKIEAAESVRREEVRGFVESLREASQAKDVVDVTTKVRLLVADMVYRIVMGRKCMEESIDGAKFSEHIHEAMQILGQFNLNDAVPWLAPFDLQGVRRQTMSVKRHIDRFLDKIIGEHQMLRKEGKKKQENFINSMLDSMDDDKDSELNFSGIKTAILDMFLGALDTAPILTDWAFVELLRHPLAMEKAKEELEHIVGLNRTVEESDIPNLPYLAMVIKETFRLHQVVPFVFRHAREDIALDGYRIPEGTDVMICVWGMGRDPTLWEKAEEFVPERFEKSSTDFRGHHFELLSFGSGRKVCPGMNLALVTAPMVLAQLVHCFDWEVPNGVSSSEEDMKEKYGFTLPRTVHLHATPTYRLVC